jgi:hypothetical protein
MKHSTLKFLFPMFKNKTFFLFLASLLSSITSQSQRCYRPNGDVASGDRSCFPDQENSFCCGTEWVCLDNKVCQSSRLSRQSNGQATFARGTCTDSSWTSEDCPKFCNNGLSAKTLHSLFY